MEIFAQQGKMGVLDALSGAPREQATDRNMPVRALCWSLVGDSIVVFCALSISVWLRFDTKLALLTGFPEHYILRSYSRHILFGTFSLIALLANLRVYKRGNLLRHRRLAFLIVKGCCLWFLGFLSLDLIFHFQPAISRLYVALCASTSIAGLLCWRGFFNGWLRSGRMAQHLRQRILLIGWNEDCQRLAETIGDDSRHPFEIVGCALSHIRVQQEPPEGIRHLGYYPDTERILNQYAIDMVILSDLDAERERIVELANLCEKQMVQFKVIPSYFQILVSGLHLETVNGVPMLGVSKLPLDLLFNVIVKRAVDICGSIVGLVLSAPLIAVLGWLVRRESPGPVFFSQERMGQNGRPFSMFKIRSMVVGAEETDHLNQSTLRSDGRLLKIGAFMRKWNLDETPQFWNVLKGDMSLVGPRPERVFHSEKLRDEIPHYSARHNVKPGITGWAQIKGFRGDTNLHERIKCDLFYLENWNLLLDVHVMLMTFVKRDNAY